MRNLAPLMTLAFLATACGPEDADGDGVPASLDCDDTRAAIYPGATEICDGVDNDCNSVVDDDYARGGQIYFLDRDGDGAGVWELAQVRCSQPVGYVDNADDCADDDPDVYPGAPEFCDRIDQNCNGDIDDEPVDGTPYYSDLDGDGYGGISSVTYSCEPLDGFITTGGDCDDFSVVIGPEAVERCNEIDDDCNGIVDDATSEGATFWYGDKDLDGYGNPEDTVQSCSQPEYYVSEDMVGDCNDGDEGINPEAREVCNDGVDNNCNGSADACSFSNWEFEEGGMVKITGSGSYAYYARDLSIVGDVNGDGFDDVVMGGYRGNGGNGSAILIYGAEDIAGEELTKSDGVDYQAGERFEYAGIAVSGLGDINNDGYDDFGVGAYGNDYSGFSSGAAYIVYGAQNAPAPGSEVSLNEVGMIYGPEDRYVYFGYGITGGDLDGDGYSDIIASAQRGFHDGSQYGTVYVRYGEREKVAFEGVGDLGYFHGAQNSESPGGRNGHGLGTGDFNADGVADLLVGSQDYDHRGRFSSGRVYTVLGSSQQVTGAVPLDEAAVSIVNGGSQYDYLGSGVAGLGDTNGDGYEDIGFCGYGISSYTGRCYVVLGSSDPSMGSVELADLDAIYTLSGKESYDYMGQNGIGSGDFDNDGYADVASGARSYQPDSNTYSTGGVSVVPGAETHEMDKYVLETNLNVIHPKVRYQYFNTVSSESGDINGDGYDDALFGADGASSYAGEAYIFFGGGL